MSMQPCFRVYKTARKNTKSNLLSRDSSETSSAEAMLDCHENIVHCEIQRHFTVVIGSTSAFFDVFSIEGTYINIVVRWCAQK